MAGEAVVARPGCIWVVGKRSGGRPLPCPVPAPLRSLAAGPAGRALVVLASDQVLALDLAARPEAPLALEPFDAIEASVQAVWMASEDHGVLLDKDRVPYHWGPVAPALHSPGGAKAAAAGSLRGRAVAALACSKDHYLATDDGGDLHAWGRGFEGQTGLYPKALTGSGAASDGRLPGQYGLVPRPARVHLPPGKSVSAVACGEAFSVCVVQPGGQLHAWGEGRCGQLGIGHTANRVLAPTPCQVGDGSSSGESDISRRGRGWSFPAPSFPRTIG